MNRDIEATLRLNTKALDLVRRAAAMPGCRFPLDYATGNPSALLFPYYSEVRELARLMSAQALLEAKHGQNQAALRDVRAVFGIAHHLSNEPVLLGFLVARAVEAIANQALARVLERVPLTLMQARAFETSLPATDWNRAFHHCFLGERAFSLFAFEMIRRPDLPFMGYIISGQSDDTSKVEENSPSWIFYPLLMLWRPVLKLDEMHSLRLWRLQLDAASNPQKFAFSNFNQTFDKAVQNEPFYAVITRVLTPSYSRVAEHRDGIEVQKREREIALALAVYRAQKGRYPQKMKELDFLWKRALPLDPYNGKPFQYRQELAGKDFLLYSVGVNHVDNGGRGPWHRDGAWKEGEDDLIWRGSLH